MSFDTEHRKYRSARFGFDGYDRERGEVASDGALLVLRFIKTFTNKISLEIEFPIENKHI